MKRQGLRAKTLAQRFPASSVLAREGAGCGSVGDAPGVKAMGVGVKVGCMMMPP